jgi:hypothetical protein
VIIVALAASVPRWLPVSVAVASIAGVFIGCYLWQSVKGT